MFLRYNSTHFLLFLCLYFSIRPVLGQSGGPCVATISPAQTVIFCSGKSVVLTANAGTNLTYQWYLNAEIITGAIAQTYVTTKPGTYQVKVSNPTGGCAANFSEETIVTESKLPEAPAFTFSPVTYECSGTPISFAVTDPVDGIEYAWDFGDGKTETGNTVTHAFYANNLTEQDFTVKLKAINANGCTSTTTSKIVTVKAGPVIKLTNPKDFRNCGGGIFAMQVSDESDVTGDVTYRIDWGDKSPVYTSENAPVALAHNYAVGIFTLKYSIISAGGCTVNKSYTVYNITNPAISANSLGNTIGCGPLTITFPITKVSSNHPSTTYTVDFGDGSPKVIYAHNELPSSVTHTYVKSSCGNPGNPPFFPVDAYVFKITASNGCGSTPAAVGGIRVYTKSEASFNIPADTSCVNTPVQFKNTTSEGLNSSCNSTTSYIWDFGDGTKSAKENPTHTYKAPGVYTVTLTAENSCSATSATKKIMVIAPPKAIFTTNIIPTSACVDATVKTTNNSTGDNVKYKWAVRPATGFALTDGSTLTSEGPGFIFNTIGTYRITLNAYNTCITDTTSRKIIIKGTPTVSLPEAQKYCGPQVLVFNAENIKHTPIYTLNNSTDVSYFWSVDKPVTFGNNTTATSQYPEIKFDAADTYTVSVTITSECGSSQTAAQLITIDPILDAPVVADVTICQDSKATFTAPQIAGTYKWYASATATQEIATGLTFTTEALKADKTYYVSITSKAGCVSPRAAVKAVVTPPVTNNILTGNQVICQGTVPTQISGSTPVGGGTIHFFWEASTNETNFEVIADATEANYLPTGLAKTTWFRRKAVSAICGAFISNIIKIEVQQPLANNTITDAQTICAGSAPALLNGTLPTGGSQKYTYLWEISTDGNNFTTATGKNQEQNYKAGNITTITWFRRKVTGGVCEPSFSEIIKITINPIPVTPLVNPVTICAGNTATLTASAAEGTLQWFTAATGGEIIATGETFTTTSLNQTTTYYVQTLANGCTSTRTPVTVTVKPAPVATAKVILSEICNNGTAAVKLTSTIAGTTFTWTVTSPANISGASNGTVNEISQILSNSGNTPATVTYTITPEANGCTGNAVTVSVVVNPDIFSNTISDAQTICAQSVPAILRGSMPQGGSGQFAYLWEVSITSATTGFTTAMGTTNGADYKPGALTQTTWYRRKVLSGNCTSITPAIEITVQPIIANNTISGNQVICVGGTVNNILGTQPTGGNNAYIFRWEVSSDGILFTEVMGATGKDYLPENPTQTTWYRRKVLSGSCTAFSSPIQIEVQQPIANNNISEEQVICAGTEPEKLTGPVPTGGSNKYTFVWEISLDNKTFTAAPGDNNNKDYSAGILTNTTWFRRKVTGGVCAASVSEVIKITVNPAIANNNITSKSEVICTGTAPATLTGTTPAGGDNNYKFIWEVSTTSATIGFIAAPGANSDKDYEAGPLTQNSWFRRKVSSGGCTVISVATLIQVNPIINNNLIISAPQTVCFNAPVTKLTATNPAGGNGAYTYEWQVSTTGPNAGFETAPGTANLKEYTPSTLKITSWFRRVVISTPCQSDISPANKIDVLDPIANNTISGVQTICAGSKPTGLAGTQPTGSIGVYSYLWEVSTTSATNGFSAAPGTNNAENYVPGTLNRTSWFRRKVLSAPCDQHISAVVEITVTPTIINTISSKYQTICAGTAASNILGDAPAGGNGSFLIMWESSIDNINFEAAAGNNTGNNYNPGELTQNMWFRRKITSGACVSYSATIEIIANPLITKNTIEGAQDLCATSTADIILGSSPAGGNGKYSYLWESSTDNKNFVAAKGIHNTRDYQPGEIFQTTWFRRRVMAGTCEPSYSEIVRISVTPGVSNNTIGTAQRICIGTTAAPLIGSAAKGGDGQISYLWEVSTTGSIKGFAPAAGINNAKDYQPDDLNKTSWFRRMIISGGCSSTSRTIQITVDAEIANNTITVAQTICTQNAPKTLTGSHPTGGNTEYIYEWELSTDGIKYTAAPGENDGLNYTPPVLTKSTWYRRVILSAPCGASESNVVLIKVLPVITVNTIENNQEICTGTAPKSITGSKPTGSTGQYIYLWESTTDLKQGFVMAAGVNNQATYSPPALTKTTYFRRVVIASPCHQIISNVVKVKVNELPLAPTIQNSTTCKGSKAQLTATGLADSFEWFNSAEATIPIFVGNKFETPEIEKLTTYYVQIRLSGCTGPRVPVHVDVYKTVANAGADVTIVKGQSSILNASGGVSYKWTATQKGVSTPIANALVTPQETTTYTVTATTADGCTSKDDVTVTVIPKIITTNGITPNGDGANDTWAIQNIEFYPQAQIEIFNRWGNKIYSSTGYNTPWDGKLNGQELPVAAYYYIIKLSKDEQPITGSITLIR